MRGSMEASELDGRHQSMLSRWGCVPISNCEPWRILPVLLESAILAPFLCLDTVEH